MGLMNARRLILAALVLLCSFAVGALPATPMAFAEELCPNIASRQGPSSALPDCRAYEQVTPISKADATDMFPGGPTAEQGPGNEGGYVAEDGERFLLYSEASLAGGDSIQSSYLFSRGTSGWAMTSLSPGPGVYKVEPNVFDTKNLTEIGLGIENVIRSPGQAETDVATSAVGPPGGPFTTIAEGATVVGASADLSHFVLESKDREWVPTPPGLENGPGLDEWFDGRLKPIDVATNGSLLSSCGAMLGNGEGNGTHNAVSGDGSRIVFTVPSTEGGGAGCWVNTNFRTPPETETNPPELYMRIDGTSSVEVSAPNRGVSPDPYGPQAAVYVGASSDDSKVFFVTRGELTADDTGQASELYEYNTEAPEGERLVRVSRGESGTAEGGVNYVPAVSNDGSTVYFAAYGKLAEGATSGALNLYHYDTTTGKTTYISPAPTYPLISNNPFTTPVGVGWGAGLFGIGPPETTLALNPHANWATTNDGQYLLFGSTQSLTGYDNVGVYESYGFIKGRDENFPFEELFRYDAANGSLVCVSCDVGGPSPVDNATFDRGVNGMDLTDAGPPHAISEDGSYAFFETGSALVPQAIPRRLHVYEWHNGKISLLSSSNDPSAAYFMGASADGSNVFVATHAQWVPQDTDQAGDVYDARIDGGFVGITASQCTGTGCQGVPGAPPIFAAPASVTFEGVGNFPSGTVAPAEQKSVKPKASDRAQKLVKALKACKRERAKHRRVRCEASAKARYSRAHRSNQSTNAGRGN